MTATLPSWLAEIPREQTHPLAFATVSGAHLYGFPSDDSDLDLRGVHLLPVEEVVGLRRDVERLTADLEGAGDASALPDVGSAHEVLHGLVVRTRLGR